MNEFAVVIREIMWPHADRKTYRKLFLQAVVEVFGLVGLQLLEGDSRFPDEFVVAEFVLITHWDPGEEEEEKKEQSSLT